MTENHWIHDYDCVDLICVHVTRTPIFRSCCILRLFLLKWCSKSSQLSILGSPHWLETVHTQNPIYNINPTFLCQIDNWPLLVHSAKQLFFLFQASSDLKNARLFTIFNVQRHIALWKLDCNFANPYNEIWIVKVVTKVKDIRPQISEYWSLDYLKQCLLFQARLRNFVFNKFLEKVLLFCLSLPSCNHDWFSVWL